MRLRQNDLRVLTSLAGHVGPTLERAHLYVAARMTADALRQSEEKFRSFVQHSPDGILQTDEEGIVIEYNEGNERLTGVPALSVIGRPLWDEMFNLAPPEQRTPSGHEELRRKIVDFLTLPAAPPHLVSEREILRPDGDRRHVQSQVFAITTGRGRMMGAITRDITDRFRTEQRMKAALAREHELSELKTRFISTTSHEFRTPLAGILSSAEMLERYDAGWSADQRLRHLHQITWPLAHERVARGHSQPSAGRRPAETPSSRRGWTWTNSVVL